MSLLPSTLDFTSESDPRVVGLDSEEADALMSALSSDTARRLLAELHEEPAPPAALAERADTSLQNAQYHLGRLSEAGAIEVVGTAYSEKGREMDVYAPADEPLVIYAGRDEDASGLRAALSQLLGGVGALALGSLLVQALLGDGLPGFASTDGSADGGGGGSGGANLTTQSQDTAAETATPTSQPTAEPTATASDGGGVSIAEATETPQATQTPTPQPTAEPTGTPMATATEAAQRTIETAASGGDPLALPPGLVFFLGGLTVLLAVALVVHWR
ncbi:helix-turn-helix domain-containing protein [Natronomonas sp. EA1]|uniref:ArsR/SmtB family transcription factor n=1 Tax=Natronomonas sp. EA1 TaxID=3421655 RepID=UPI003EBEE98E